MSFEKLNKISSNKKIMKNEEKQCFIKIYKKEKLRVFFPLRRT
jgi:hypothetical protein